MKSKAPEKAAATAREKARVLEDKARQAGRAARAAKDRLRQAKAKLKLAKEEANQARKAAKAAKRTYSEANDASEEAVAEAAALEQRIPVAQASAAPARAKSRKPNRARARKAAPTRPKPRAATVRSRVVKSPVVMAVHGEPETSEAVATVQPAQGTQEVRIQLPSDITVPTDVFSGTPAPSEGFALPDSETSSQ